MSERASDFFVSNFEFIVWGHRPYRLNLTNIEKFIICQYNNIIQ